MVHIFISYCRQDRNYARDLAESIRTIGFDVWIDDRVDYGQQWWQTVIDGIQESVALVVLMSPEAERSEWVEREILVAQRQSKPIVPLLLRGYEFPLLITTQAINVTDGRLPPESFYSRLRYLYSPPQAQGRYIVPPDIPASFVKSQTSPRMLLAFLGIAILFLGVGIAIYLKDELEANFQPAIPHTIVRSYPNWQPQEHLFLDVPMVLVPAGCFIDKILNSHCFQSTFWIDKYEVTQAIFERLGGVKAFDNHWEGDNLPVTNVTSEEAQLFCQIRGGRLPSHVEWEYAALSQSGRVHSLASQIDLSQIVASHTADNQPAEVGSFPEGESWVGALDLLGNVWEWTTVDTDHYTLRGGSWRSLPHLLSIASTMAVIPDFTSDDAGFRCVVEG